MNDSENKKGLENKAFAQDEKKIAAAQDEKKIAAALDELDAEMEKLAERGSFKPMTPEEIMREAQAMYSYATEFSQYEAAFAEMEAWMDAESGEMDAESGEKIEDSDLGANPNINQDINLGIGSSTSMGSSVGSSVGSQADSSIGSSVCSHVDSSIGSSVCSHVGSSVGSSTSMGSSVGSSVGSQADSSIGLSVGSNAGTSVGLSVVPSDESMTSQSENPGAFRIEHDTMGEVQVPADKYWGAQTQRSLMNFQIGTEKMPRDIIKAFGILKKAAALANMELGMLDRERGNIIDFVCDELIMGKLEGNFPLAVWQTGSGTQSNMNVNEVIANRAKEFAPEGLEIHPNNHVNCSQSSNDTFPTAMHIAALLSVETHLIPSIDRLISTFDRLSANYADIIKTGRTHLQDATPLTLGQEISGWSQMLKKDKEFIKTASDSLRELALGGTAVGTGLNSHEAFGAMAAEIITALTGTQFTTAPNKFHALTSKDQIVFVHGAMKALAADMMKIANDVRWLSSGPRCGIGELKIPENEPGSSIMPGKVNPTQCEAVTMVAVQVMGNDATIGFAASQGNFQLNVFMPVIAYNFLQSVHLLSDSIDSFNKNCAAGIEPNRERIAENLSKSLMLVTALNPYIGYENAAAIAKKAYAEGTSLKEAAVASGLLTEAEFDEYVRPEKMVGPRRG